MELKVGEYKLDEEQIKIVLDESKHLLVVAGAGSGKTLTILGKIDYLVNTLNIPKDEIMCISFTRAASESLKEKIKKEFEFDIDVWTFHKLALNILGNKYKIASQDTLEYIIDDFFLYDLVDNEMIYKYLKVKNKNEYLNELEKSDVKKLKRLLSTFIHLFKCNNYKLEDFNTFLKKIKKIYNFHYKKEKMILLLALNIYLKYQQYLKKNNEIDFDDMLILATKQIKKSYIKKLKYIIIDEYQDTSLVRFNLIKSILEKTNAKLMVVGDDFQSIYRFTGCDINLFLNFNNYFKDGKILKIQNTYRNSQELIKIAGDFVMKNKKQIKKDLKSNKHLLDPICICYYNYIKKDFKRLLEQVYNGGELLVLGRNNDDIKYIIDDNFKVENDTYYYKHIKFKYMTIHKSKGLESDDVIVINMKNAILGFPSQIEEEKILRLVSKYDKYPFSEERRLFYVALTRTKNRVYLYTPIKDKSIFIEELIKHYKLNSKKMSFFDKNIDIK